MCPKCEICDKRDAVHETECKVLICDDEECRKSYLEALLLLYHSECDKYSD